MSNKRLPLVIVGLDGAGFHLLDALMAGGRMPHLQALREQGWQADLLSTQPPATLPAWTSFLTASSPEVHGVCDMFAPLPPGYGLQTSGGAMRQVPTFLRVLSEAGLQVASLGVPGTYPPEQVRGICVSGFDAPGVREVNAQGVYPASVFKTLRALGGWRFATFNENAANPAQSGGATRMLLRDLDAKERVILHVLTMQTWDVFFVHLQASDTAAHHLWHTWDTQSPRHTRKTPELETIYERLDRLVGSIRAAAPHPCRMMVVSDHGMGGASDIAVHINRRLHRGNWLHFESSRRRALQKVPGALLRTAAAALPTGAVGATLRHLPKRFSGNLMAHARHLVVDYARSSAFSFELDYAPAIWLNRQGMFEHGSVGEAQADGVLQAIAQDMRAWRCPFTHQPMFDAVIPRAPHHLFAHRAPDLTLVPAWPGGYRHSFLPSPGPGPEVCTMSPRAFQAPKGGGMPGVHRREGIFIAHGPGIAPQRLAPLNIADAGAMVYAMARLTPPAFSDADQNRISNLWPQGAPAPALHSGQTHPGEPYTESQRHAMLSRLADMGYL